MHFRMFLTFNKDHATNPDEAKEYALRYLVDNNFANQNGRWGYSPADWFVIGGRWSGFFIREKMSFATDAYESLGGPYDAVLLTQELYDEHLKEFEDKAECGEYEDSGHWMWVDADYDDCSKKLVDKKWLVVVDYHN